MTLGEVAVGVLIAVGLFVLLWLVSALVAVVVVYRAESPNRAPRWPQGFDDRRTGNR